MSKYQDSLDNGADNSLRLSGDAARQMIRHGIDVGYGNKNGHRPDNKAGSDKGSEGAGGTAHSRNVGGDGKGLSANGSGPRGTQLDTGLTGGSHNMGGINPGTGGSGHGSSAGIGSAAREGRNMTGQYAAGGAEAGMTGSAAKGAAASGAAGGTGAAAAMGSAEAGAAAAAGGSGGIAAGAAAAVILLLFAFFFLVSFLCFFSGLFTYTDQSIMSYIGKDGVYAENDEDSGEYEHLSSVTITGDAVNVRDGAGTNNENIGIVHNGGKYTMLGKKTVRNEDGIPVTWFKIQYDATTTGWVSGDYCEISQGGGNRFVELANSIHSFVADDCAEILADAKADARSQESIYGGNIKPNGEYGLGGPKGETGENGRCFEYIISDGGLTTTFNDDDSKGMNADSAISLDVPYILAAFSYYFEKDNDKIDLTTATTDEVWTEIEKLMDGMFTGSHDYYKETEPYRYRIPNRNYNQPTGETDEDGDPVIDNEMYTEINGYYYSYGISSESLDQLVQNKLGFTEEEDLEAIDAKSICIAQLLYELGGLTYTSKTSHEIYTGQDSFDRADDLNIATSGEWIWPVPSCRSVSSKFGQRIHPLTGKVKFHKGIDIPAAEGAHVYAVKAGTVIKVVKSCTHNNRGTSCKCGGGYGNYILIDHGNGYKSRYAHLMPGHVGVNVGDKVNQGAHIADVGTTGASTGPHLHFEIMRGNDHKNPLNYVSYR